MYDLEKLLSIIVNALPIVIAIDLLIVMSVENSLLVVIAAVASALC